MLFDNNRVEYSIREFTIVFFCIVLSKSLYYESYGNNLLLVLFMGYLVFCYNPLKVKVSKLALLYSFFSVFLIVINVETSFSSLLVFILRLSISLYIVQQISFVKFSVIYTKIILFLVVSSLLTLIVIYFNIPSPLPEFLGTDDRPLRNFLFFGVSEGFITHSTFRNSGLWWEPGAFQIFINLAFLFSIVNGTINKKIYTILAVGIATTLSTTGVMVFVLLTCVYLYNQLRTSRYISLYIFSFLIIGGGIISWIIPFLLVKFGGSGNEVSVSFLSRYYDFLISLNMLVDNPILGYGFGSQIENAIPYGRNLIGALEYDTVVPTGADGITMLLAQCGIFSIFILIPLLLPKYCNNQPFVCRMVITISLIMMFNTQNFSFILIFTLLSIYGLLGNKRRS